MREGEAMKEIELKEEVVRTAKKAEEIGLFKHKSGNVSAIDREKGVVYITPSGISRQELRSDMIAAVDLEGNIIDAPYKPSIETKMHVRAYKIKEKASGIVHSHSRYATLFACMPKEILPVTVEAIHYGGNIVEVAEYAPPGTCDLAECMEDVMKDSDVCLLKYHGVLAVGQTLEKALLNAMYVEEVAFLYYHMLALGQTEFMPINLLENLKNG